MTKSISEHLDSSCHFWFGQMTPDTKHNTYTDQRKKNNENGVEYCMSEFKQKFTTMDVSNVIPFIGIGEFDSALFPNLNLN